MHFVENMRLQFVLLSLDFFPSKVRRFCSVKVAASHFAPHYSLLSFGSSFVFSRRRAMENKIDKNIKAIIERFYREIVAVDLATLKNEFTQLNHEKLIRFLLQQRAGFQLNSQNWASYCAKKWQYWFSWNCAKN